MTVKRGDSIEVRIDSLAYGGAGVGRVDGYVCFVKHAAPGDHVRVRVHKRKKGYCEGEIEELIAPGPDRIAPPCPYFGVCGGCSWQHIPYARQLEIKRQLVEDSLTRIGGLEGVAVPPVAPSPAEWRYRNKIDLTFGRSPFGAAAEDPERSLGFHRPNDFKRILDIQSCLIQPEPFDRALQTARRHVIDLGLTCHDPVRHEGMLRHLLLRHSVAADEMVAVVASATPPSPGPDAADLAARLRRACPELRGFLWGINDQRADVFTIERDYHREGDLTLEERLGDVRFRVSPLSFFQTNTRAARVLYDIIAGQLALTGSETVLDAYCGTGSIGIYCAARARQVWGLELIREAVWNARENAALNGLDNCRFIAGDARQTLRLAREEMRGRPDRVIVDPPRGGMHQKALAGLIELQAPMMIYVSCNPTTLARDLTDILAGGYRLTAVQPVDLFPQTYHIETVCRFEKPRDDA